MLLVTSGALVIADAMIVSDDWQGCLDLLVVNEFVRMMQEFDQVSLV